MSPRVCLAALLGLLLAGLPAKADDASGARGEASALQAARRHGVLVAFTFQRDAAREEKRKALRKKHELKAEETQAMLKGVRTDRKAAGSSTSENMPETKATKTRDNGYGVIMEAPSVAPSAALSTQQNTSMLLGKALLIKMKIEMELQGKGWHYKDATGSVQGPFDGDAMASWYTAGYLASDLLISSSSDGDFYSLAAVMEGSNDPEVAFEEELDLRDLTDLRTQLASLL